MKAHAWLIVCLLGWTTSSVQATATIFSVCDFPVFYKSIAGAEENFTTLPRSGAAVEYVNNRGISVKISTDPSVLNPQTPQGPILQMEFTWAPDQGMLYYDLSNINGAPFAAYGMVLQPSTNASALYQTCLPVGCAAGANVCPSVYTISNGDNTMACAASTDLTLLLCMSPPAKRQIGHRGSHQTHHKKHGNGMVETENQIDRYLAK